MSAKLKPVAGMKFVKRINETFQNYAAKIEKLGPVGYSLVVGGTMLGPEHFECSYPEEWMHQYEQMGFFKLDPVLLYAISARGGDKRWSEINIPGTRGFMRKAETHGLKYGAVFIRRIGQGNSFVSLARSDRELHDVELDVASRLITDFFADITQDNLLSAADLAAIQCLADGLSVSESADELGISTSAVKMRLTKARKKTGIPSNNGLIGYAMRKMLIR